MSGRERRPYQFNSIVEKLRDLARQTDDELEEALAVLIDGLADDGMLDDAEEHELMAALVKAYGSNGKTLNIMNLLDDSSLEAAQREVERLERRSRKG